MKRIEFHGWGLHTGERVALTLTRSAGPVWFAKKQSRVIREELEILRADFGVKVRARHAGWTVELIEHLCAALGGLGIHAGVCAEIEGPEIPLLDGGSREIASALIALNVPPSATSLRIVRPGELTVGESRYVFEPADAIELSVEVNFEPFVPGLQRAHWSGSAEQFLAEIAPARTFGFLRDAAQHAERGRARRVDPSSVIVIDDHGHVLPPGAPLLPTELARHKLLDLIGDLYLFGGPPVGRLSAWRPGHERNHRLVRKALELGFFARIRS